MGGDDIPSRAEKNQGCAGGNGRRQEAFSERSQTSAIEILSAIRAAARGEAICPTPFVRALFDYVASQSPDLPNARTRMQWGLTRREQQLIPLIGRGMTNKEIASQLSLSEQTVKNHVHRILRKVGVEDRLGVVGQVFAEANP